MKFVCTKCNAEFGPGAWECFPGERHEVAEKTYRIGSSIPDFADRQKSRVSVYVTADIRKRDAQGNEFTDKARAVEFVRGIFTTTNPEDQFFFDT